MKPETQQLRDLVARSEAWLAARIIHYAKERNYTPFTSTLEEAWLASIRGLSAPLIEALDEGRDFAAVAAATDYSRDPIARYGVEAAKRHRSRGVTLGLFLGLMKSYRESYLDLVAGEPVLLADRLHNRAVIDSFFDRMEVGFCDEWSGRPADEQFEQLREKTQQLTNEKNKYLTIFESLQDPVILIDENGKVENVNHAALTLFAGQAPPGASYYGGARIPVEALFGDGLRNFDDLTGERLLPTNIGPRWFDIKTQRMLDVSEKYLGAVIILNDVTEYRRAREEAEQADRAKSAFLATMSHEIRTPIHGILGLAELLRRGGVAGRDREYVDAIARSGELLSSVVSDVLDYSKIEAGVLDLERVEFDGSALLESVFDLSAPLVARKPQLRLRVYAPRLPPMIGDPGKLRQILLNLVGNAVKFTERGHIDLRVNVLEEDERRIRLLFEVYDTGIGIAPEKAQLIFDPFTQSDASVGRRFGGSGLGLTICRRLVERLGGEIGVDSIPGEGSRFWFTAPCDLGLAKLHSIPDGRLESEPAARVLGILVVEDNEVNAMVAAGLLAREGHRVALARNGGEALALFESRDFDVVLLDLRLPDLDGLEVLGRIRESPDPIKRRTPVIMLSAQALANDIAACAEAGADEFIIKPFKIDRLRAVLRRVSGLSAMTEATERSVLSPQPMTPDPYVDSGIGDDSLDESVLAEHIALLGADPTQRIVEAFEANTAPVAAEIERLAASGERRALAALAHRLKSSALHVGLTKLSRSAGALELLAREDSAPVAAAGSELAAACRDGLVLVKQAFDRMTKPQPANT